MKEEKIKVLALLPMELPKEIELDNTLEAIQKFVGGLIESRLFVCTSCYQALFSSNRKPTWSHYPCGHFSYYHPAAFI